MQVKGASIENVSFVTDEVNVLEKAGDWEHITHPLPQCLKPVLVLDERRQVSAGASFALIKRSLRFLGLDQQTIGG